MLKKTERLSRSEFTHYFKIGKRINSEYFTIVISPALTFKAVAVVGKKVHKEAVDRNRLKRQVYAQLQVWRKSVVGVYLVLVKPPLAKKTKAERNKIITEEIGLLLNKR